MTVASRDIVVLLVDDQPIVGEAVRRMLAEEADIKFHFCPAPERALAVAAEVHPTVILQDLVMPGMDGLTLVAALRADPLTRDVPLIVLSTKEDPQVKVDAFARGANDYLVKLPHQQELVARIRYHSQGYIRLLERNEAFLQLERQSRFIRDTFGRYVSDEIVAQILETPGGLSMGGEKRLVTIMFADLRGFTAMSETLPPEQVVALINTFLEAMTDVIFAHGGTIDEFIGDAILVIFGAPVLRADDARRAVACALAMQLAMGAVNERNRGLGLPPVEMGIGLHTGDVVCGNIGSHKRAKYGVVGSTVNLAARIESFTVGGQILVSAGTRAAANAELRIDGQLEVLFKGVRDAITLYEIGGIGPPEARTLPLRDTALVALTAPVAIAYTMLEGKLQGETGFPGQLVRVSEIEAEVLGERPPRAFTDVRLDPTDGTLAAPIYGKVMPRAPSRAPGFIVRFTSVSPADAATLKGLRSDGG